MFRLHSVHHYSAHHGSVWGGGAKNKNFIVYHIVQGLPILCITAAHFKWSFTSSRGVPVLLYSPHIQDCYVPSQLNGNEPIHCH